MKSTVHACSGRIIHPVHLDLVLQATAAQGETLHQGGSVVGRVVSSLGGVCMNVARCLSRLIPKTTKIILVSAVGMDQAGNEIIGQCQKDGIDTRYLMQDSNDRTPKVVVLFDDSGDVSASVADVSLLERVMTPSVVVRCMRDVSDGSMVVVDGDVSQESIEVSSS